MQLFEEPIGSLFTDGPAIVVKVEQRKEQRVRSIYDHRAMEWDEFGVVIYMAKGRALPDEKAVETRFILVPDSSGSCQIPENAGRVLGHFRQNGRRWWCFLEKLGSSEAPSPPGAGEQRKSTGVSQPSKAAPGARVAPPAKPSVPPTSPAQQRPSNNAAQGGR
jgi:hypothetical protein